MMKDLEKCGINNCLQHNACISMCYEMKIEWPDIDMWLISLLLQTLRL